MHGSECDIEIWWTRGWKCRMRAQPKCDIFNWARDCFSNSGQPEAKWRSTSQKACTWLDQWSFSRWLQTVQQHSSQSPQHSMTASLQYTIYSSCSNPLHLHFNSHFPLQVNPWKGSCSLYVSFQIWDTSWAYSQTKMIWVCDIPCTHSQTLCSISASVLGPYGPQKLSSTKPRGSITNWLQQDSEEWPADAGSSGKPPLNKRTSGSSI